MIRARAAVYIVLACLAQGLAGCEDDCSTYSENRFNCSQIAKADYNVVFSLPDQSELPLGKISGLSNCAIKASDYAKAHDVPKKYYCCMVTKTSDCAEKHR